MVNREDFSQRLEKILEFYDISAAAFAEAIEVGRSSISHILSGRNKPSLDFVLKIVHTYPEVELYWLLNGKGSFPASKENSSRADKPVTTSSSVSENIPEKPESAAPSIPIKHSAKGKTIQKIVIFYTDGSFDAFEN